MAVGDTYVFPGCLTPVLTQLFFSKPPTAFLTCFCRGERRKYAGKKSCLNRGSNSQPPGHQSDMLTTELPGRCSEKCEISKAIDGIEDDLFQMDSFNSSDNNFEDHFSKKVQESFRKRRQGHPSYF